MGASSAAGAEREEGACSIPPIIPVCCCAAVRGGTAVAGDFPVRQHGSRPGWASAVAFRGGGARAGQQALGRYAQVMKPVRSEERRVGEECRSRWATYH